MLVGGEGVINPPPQKPEKQKLILLNITTIQKKLHHKTDFYTIILGQNLLKRINYKWWNSIMPAKLGYSTTMVFVE